ncbi:MAG: hypothetical protein DRJ03_03575 [Chloroflexi bacterium]|nr:MAG: hypothetical protein DRJ03_03575 [Chloroflexota bacterium]
MPKIEKIYADFAISSKAQSKLLREIEKDFEFALGKQWEPEDVETLRKAGVKALTINRIKPMIKIITGIERQSRSDLIAFPEGGEDVIRSEISTRLLKNVVKLSRVDKKLSDQFKEGMTGGLCYCEGFLDYTYNLINGSMKFRKLNANRIFPDPDGEEYDLSDRRFVIKYSPNLTRDQVLELFPEDEDKIDKVGMRRVDLKDMDAFVEHIQKRDYENAPEVGDAKERSNGYDLVEYYYKNWVTKYFAVDRESGTIKETDSKEEAEKFIEENEFEDPHILKKQIPEIWLQQVIGDQEFTDEVAWSYPRWKFYPFFQFIGEQMTVDIKDTDLLIQGITRGLRDLQEELNKRRTQELRHLNSTANSGWMFPKGALDRRTKDRFKQFGSSPGFVGEYDTSKTGGVVNPETFRIRPAPLSTGHKELAAESEKDIKESSGINPDLLANDSQSQSGRAILLKQRQGLVMVQESLDNYSETKQILGRFILSQLGEIYTVETASRVLGDAFLSEHFSGPVLGEDNQPVLNEDGSPKIVVNADDVGMMINQILNDASLGKYDVSIGEGAYAETTRLANFVTLMEMTDKGIPIPPDVIIEESALAESQKKKIMAAIAAAQQAQDIPQE